MSTEHLSQHDLEYGPTPPGARHEHTDIDVNLGYKFAMWLALSMLLSVGIVWGTFYVFEGQEKSASTLAQKYPLAATLKPKDPPLPNLQKQPFKDVLNLRNSENKQLTAYGWVDKDGGITHIPIAQAMEVMLQRGFPSRSEGGNALDVVTQDSSSGRTVVPR